MTTRACTVSKRSYVVLRSCGSLLVFILWTTACNVLSYCTDSNKKNATTVWPADSIIKEQETSKFRIFGHFRREQTWPKFLWHNSMGFYHVWWLPCWWICILLHYSHACDDHCYSYCSNALLTPINSSLPGQYGHRFADDLFRGNFVNERLCNLILISLKFVPMRTIDNKAALVQVMAWRWIGYKPLPEPMLTQFTDVLINRRPITVRAALVGLLLTFI